MEAKVDNILRWRLMPSEGRLKNFWNLKNKQTFHFNNHSQIFSLCLNFSLCHRKIFSLCLKIFPCVKAKFPVFSLSGKSKNQIPCFPCGRGHPAVVWPRVYPKRVLFHEVQTTNIRSKWIFLITWIPTKLYPRDNARWWSFTWINCCSFLSYHTPFRLEGRETL